jgi:hypothetical protein
MGVSVRGIRGAAIEGGVFEDPFNPSAMAGTHLSGNFSI